MRSPRDVPMQAEGRGRGIAPTVSEPDARRLVVVTTTLSLRFQIFVLPASLGI